MMIAVVTTLDPREDRRGLAPRELDTRLVAGAGHLKNSSYSANGSIKFQCLRDSESLKHFECSLLKILSTCQAVRQLKILPLFILKIKVFVCNGVH
jgi:hypothetical protein